MKLLSMMIACLLVVNGFAAPQLRADDAEHSGSGHSEAGHAGGHHEEIGHPPVEPEVFDPNDLAFDLAVYTLVVFVLLLLVLTKFAWGPVMSALDEREVSIRRNIEEAETARVRSEEVLAEHAKKLDAVQDEVREILAEARRDAEHTKAEILAAAETEAAATKKRALDEVQRAQDQALKELFDNMSTHVGKATESVLGRALTEGDESRLVDETLADMLAHT